MSLTTDLTSNQEEIQNAEREASALLRRARALLPPALYNELQLKMCIIASEATKLEMNLGAMRMIGELEQQPPPVTVETLELTQYVPRHALRDESAAFARELKKIGDDTLTERGAA